MFRYLNLNPYKKRTGDCVIRAVACAFDVSWEGASDMLYKVARKSGCEMSCIGCYSGLFYDMGLPEVPVNGFTVEQVSEKYSDKIVLIRIPGHLTCSRYGTVFDIWDCTDEVVDRAWIVE